MSHMEIKWKILKQDIKILNYVLNHLKYKIICFHPWKHIIYFLKHHLKKNSVILEISKMTWIMVKSTSEKKKNGDWNLCVVQINNNKY